MDGMAMMLLKGGGTVYLYSLRRSASANAADHRDNVCYIAMLQGIAPDGCMNIVYHLICGSVFITLKCRKAGNVIPYFGRSIIGRMDRLLELHGRTFWQRQSLP